jgi:hypothetical protein
MRAASCEKANPTTDAGLGQYGIALDAPGHVPYLHTQRRESAGQPPDPLPCLLWGMRNAMLVLWDWILEAQKEHGARTICSVCTQPGVVYRAGTCYV